VYEASKETRRFTEGNEIPVSPISEPPVPRLGRSRRAFAGETGRPGRVLDVRQVNIGSRTRQAIRDIDQRWDGFQVAAPQVAALMDAGVDTAAMTVVVPDFMNYARQINSGHAARFVRNLGVRSVFSMGMRAMRSAAADRGVTFWTVARSLLAADLASLPWDFDGTILLHSFLVDLGVALDRPDRIGPMLSQVRAKASHASLGIQTNILRDALNLLVYLETPVQSIHFLSSPGCAHAGRAVEQLRASRRFGGTHLGAEVGSVPSALFAEIMDRHGDWLQGADTVVVDALCDPRLAGLRRKRLEKAWKEAFPGTLLPSTAL
jgi:hypothetical protein